MPIQSTHNWPSIWKNGNLRLLGNELQRRLFSTSLSLGFKKDLNRSFVVPEADIPVSVRFYREGDLDYLFEYGAVEAEHPRLTSIIKTLAEEDISNCYVAVNRNDKACLILWLYAQNKQETVKLLHRYTPSLNEDEALLVTCFLHRSYRGLGIMPNAVCSILNKYFSQSINSIITFVDVNDIACLKGIKRSGFEPYLLKQENWRGFMHTDSYKKIPDEMLQYYHRITADTATSRATVR